MKECLGRSMANFSFALKFSQLAVEVMAACSSDHAPLHVILKDPHGTRQSRRGLFRFESWWQKKKRDSRMWYNGFGRKK
jgi:hypothetical protein